MIIKICDRCGKEIHEPKCGLFGLKNYYSVGFFIKPEEEKSDEWMLCPECLKKFKRFLED